MNETGVVTCVLRHEGAVLLLRRSEAVGSYPGLWGGVAGHAEGDPDAAAWQEIREETGLAESEVTLVRRGEPFEVTDDVRGTRWRVHPYLFDCETRAITTNWETAGAEWVAPTAILHRETVPDLWQSYDRVRPGVETVATDRDHGAAYISVRALEVLRDEAALANARGTGDWERLVETARDLLAARPSMSVVKNRVNRTMDAASRVGTAGALEHVAAAEITHAVTADRRAADRAAEHIAGERVATLSRSGTVLSALREGAPEAVLVAESRPGREGVGVAETLAGGTDVTLTTDAGFAGALAEFDADALLVGADTVLADGRVVNKVGTRGAAIASSLEGIDVLVAAAADKLSADGEIDLEPRDGGEVYDGEARIAVRNPTFDVTPPDCVDAVLTERGALDVAAARAVAAEHRRHAGWD
jgi:translation initiation factor 2B subunit (eIF-2B alpha/beta/delta family)